MTADIINLRKARKVKARAEAQQTASENRVSFGRSKAERERTSAILDIDRGRLDGAKRAYSDEDDELDPGSVS